VPLLTSSLVLCCYYRPGFRPESSACERSASAAGRHHSTNPTWRSL